jgi:integrase
MPRQYAREPLSLEEGNRLIQACETLRERQVILILLDTGLRVSELAQLTKHNILWQERRCAERGAGGRVDVPRGGHQRGLYAKPTGALLPRVQVLRHHAFGAETRYETVGQVYLGLPPDFPVLAF